MIICWISNRSALTYRVLHGAWDVPDLAALQSTTVIYADVPGWAQGVHFF